MGRALVGFAVVLSTGVVSVGTSTAPAPAVEPTPAVGDVSNLGLGVAGPLGITPGPDGALWFVNTGNDSIGRISTSGELTSFPAPGTDALNDVTAGPDGNLWFTSKANDLIGRMTPAGDVTTFPVDVPYPPDGVHDIVAGPDGTLWFTGMYDSVGRITPAGVVTLFSSPEISSFSIGITPGSDGNLWFTIGDDRIGRVTPAGVITTFTSAAVRSPEHLALGSDGNLWFTNGGAKTIGRITPGGVITSFSLPTVSGADNLAAGPDGALWYVDNEDDAVGRMTTTGTASVVADVPGALAAGGNWVSGLTTGPDGNVWFTDGNLSTFGRVTPGGIVTTYRDAVSWPVDLIADDDGNLWIANEREGVTRRSPDGTMTRFDDPALSGPRSLAIGPDGNLWVTTEGGIVRMTPDGVTTTFTHPDVRWLYAITAGPDGRVWFTYVDGETSARGGIGAITMAGVFALHPDDAVISSPGGIVAGPDGNLWFANRGGSQIGRVTPAGAITGFPAALGTLDLAVGPDGNIWYTSECENIWPCPKDTVGVMSTTGATADFTGSGIDGAIAITAGRDGYLYFANARNSSLGRVQAFGRPAPPSAPVATPGPASVTVTWAPPASDGGSPITSYTVTGPEGAALTCTRSAPPFSCTFSGLTRERDHRFQVHATNEHGDSGSAVTGFVRPQSTPSPPEDLHVHPGNGFAIVRWDHPADSGGLPLTGFSITPVHGGQADPAVLVGPDVGQAVIDDLSNDVAYELHVVALNPLGASEATVSDVVTPSTAVGDLFHALAPTRIVDSRPGSRNVGDFSTPWGTAARSVVVAGRGGVPAGADAVVLNVAAVNPTARSYLTILPDGGPAPTRKTSSLNFVPGAVVANQVTVPLGPTGRIKVQNAAGTTDVVIDVAGYFDSGIGAGFLPAEPSRIVDTRPGPRNIGDHSTPLGTTTRPVVIAGRGDIPSWADAVVLNVAVVNPTATSHLTVSPTGSPVPRASNLNYRRNDVVANQVTVPLGPDGRLNLTNHAGTVDVVIDVVGFFDAEIALSGFGFSFHPVVPARILDSRPGLGNVGGYTTPWSLTPRDVVVGGRGGIPAAGAVAVVGNLAVAGPTASSYLRVRPSGTPATSTSSINFDQGEIVANHLTAMLGANRSLTITNAAGKVDVILDVSGWYG